MCRDELPFRYREVTRLVTVGHEGVAVRIRRTRRGVPQPETPWDEIVPGLWMGGHLWYDATGAMHPVVVGDEFDVVVSLYAAPGHGPAPDVEHIVAEIPDGPLDAAQLAAARHAAAVTATAVRQGRTTLVRCRSGLNRSGLVLAQALVDLGRRPAGAVALIRDRRSRAALNNALFVDYLTTGLDLAAELTTLELDG